MWIKRTFQIEEAAKECGLEQEILISWIHNEWIVPANKEETELDQEDIARARLIRSLQSEFGVNNESVAIILHLLDQLHFLHGQIKKGS
jgi:chaperone modulatory protein CbpM